MIRYASDGGYAAVEWLNAFESVEFPPSIADGGCLRMGVQITKKRAIDVILRVEILESWTDRMRGKLNRTRSDALFRHPRLCKDQIPGAHRPLALLSARHMGIPVRIVVCEPLAN